MLYEDLYCARSNCENAIKAVKNDTATARRPPPSWPTRCGSSSRVPPLSSIMPYGRTPSNIPPWPGRNSTVILTLFKIATQIKQYKDRILLHLPSSCQSAVTSGDDPAAPSLPVCNTS